MIGKSSYPSGLYAGSFEVLIHYFYTSDPLPNSYRLLELQLVELGLIKIECGQRNLTERGTCLAKYIVNLPLPVAAPITWKMP